MSYTKDIFENNINKSVEEIISNTLLKNDCSILLNQVNNMMTVRDEFVEENEECGLLWNEICIDVISVINSAFSGFYRTAIIGLRSIFEMGCSSIYYHDHMIEYYLFKNENMKADKYVSSLVNEHNFFKTKYIKAFNIEFSEKQTEEDSVAKYLTKLYGELSDVVHGRYNKLTNIEKFKIEYDVNRYKQFENLFIKTTNILLVLAILRFSINDITIVDKNKIFENTGVGKYE